MPRTRGLIIRLLASEPVHNDAFLVFYIIFVVVVLYLYLLHKLKQRLMGFAIHDPILRAITTRYDQELLHFQSKSFIHVWNVIVKDAKKED